MFAYIHCFHLLKIFFDSFDYIIKCLINGNSLYCKKNKFLIVWKFFFNVMVNKAYFKIWKSACLDILTHESHPSFDFSKRNDFWIWPWIESFLTLQPKLQFDTSLRKKIIHFSLLILTKYHQHVKTTPKMWPNKILPYILYNLCQ